MKSKSSKKIFLIIFLGITLIRFLISFNLKSLYISNLSYDDGLMIKQMSSLISGQYLGVYDDFLLIKGIVFPFLLSFCKNIHVTYSIMFTILYILSVIYFIKPFEKLIRNKYFMFIFYVLLLFNPITYSSELFQRLYRNSISIIEVLFFLGVTIRIIISDDKTKSSVLNYLLLGIITSIMYLTREDNIWTKIILGFIVVYKCLQNKNLKNKRFKIILASLIPIIVLTFNLNIVSFVNYKKYNIYTYNEIQKSEFKNTFRKVLQIKDDEKKDKVSVPRTTFFKLVDNCETFNITKREINQYYKVLIDDTGEIYNGNIVWYFRQFLYKKNKFKDGKEAENYFKKLGEEIDKSFSEGRFEKEYAFPSILLNVPTYNEFVNMHKNLFKIVAYTSTYKNVKTITDFSKFNYDEEVDAYRIVNLDSHTTENIVKKNDKRYEVIRFIYMILTVILSPVALIIYLYNIEKKDIYNLITTIILFIYLIILAGVTYTDATAFPTMRYLCLGNIYILQTIFIILNMYRLYRKSEEINFKMVKK
ncbi:MAG: hypothetical protein IK997_05695 [Bacilli bacterium]|nr:hypothetical protein [Bacilli bacterium]